MSLPKGILIVDQGVAFSDNLRVGLGGRLPGLRGEH